MAIKHLKPRKQKELLDNLRADNIDEDLIKACSRNAHVSKLVTDYLMIEPDLCMILGIFEKRVKQLNEFFKVFCSYAKNAPPQV